MKNLITLVLLTVSAILCGTEKRGAVCFTFDDYAGKNWLKADTIFKKYNARVTFFIVGKITPEKIAVMKKLQSAGHSIGLHSISHRNIRPLPKNWTEKTYFAREIKPQLDICRQNGINVKGFAYPNNRRTENSDLELFKHFDYLRAGLGKARKTIYYPLNALKDKMLLGGGGIGVYYKSDVNELKKILSAAAASNSMVVFFSHDIKPQAKGVHMPVEMLEQLLAHAAGLNMHIVGINDLKRIATPGKN